MQEDVQGKTVTRLIINIVYYSLLCRSLLASQRRHAGNMSVLMANICINKRDFVPLISYFNSCSNFQGHPPLN